MTSNYNINKYDLDQVIARNSLQIGGKRASKKRSKKGSKSKKSSISKKHSKSKKSVISKKQSGGKRKRPQQYSGTDLLSLSLEEIATREKDNDEDTEDIEDYEDSEDSGKYVREESDEELEQFEESVRDTRYEEEYDHVFESWLEDFSNFEFDDEHRDLDLIEAYERAIGLGQQNLDNEDDKKNDSSSEDESNPIPTPGVEESDEDDVIYYGRE